MYLKRVTSMLLFLSINGQSETDTLCNFFVLFVQRENGKHVHCFAIYKIYGSKWAFVHFFLLLLLSTTTTHLLLISFLYFISLFTKRFSMKNERQGDNIITKFIWNVYFMWLIIIHVADIFQMKVETFESKSILFFFFYAFDVGFLFLFLFNEIFGTM